MSLDPQVLIFLKQPHFSYTELGENQIHFFKSEQCSPSIKNVKILLVRA